MMRSHWLQSGISMVQGMVISSVLAGSALIASRMITTQKLALKSNETKDHIQQLHKIIFTEMQNREHCLMTLGGIVVGLTPGTPQSFNVNSIMSKAGPGSSMQQLTVNTGTTYNDATTYMNGHVRIHSMTLQTTANLGDPQPFVINYRRLEKGGNTRTKQGYGGSSISRTVWIRLQRAAAGSTSINGCYAVEMGADSDSGAGNSNLNQEFCDNLGTGGSLYTWDSVRNTCVLKNNICGSKEVFEGIDTNGSAVCRSINEYLPYLVKPGTNPCSGTKTRVAVVRDPVTNLVSIECY